MKTYKKTHESKEVAAIHAAKIEKRGGVVRQSVSGGKILLEYWFPKPQTFVGYRNKRSAEKGKYGTFYNVKKPTFYDTNEVVLVFKNPLVVNNDDVYNFEGLSLEYLFWEWFPDYNLSLNAKKQGIESGELIDKLVTEEAIKRGYDGIVMADLEIIDLSTHSSFKPAFTKQKS